jgi:conjugative relaxase-like TrwC/TraI family protein
MLNIGSIKSAGGTAEYHTSKESQLANENFQGTEWLGEGAARLGLEGEASDEDLEAILSGELPAGEDQKDNGSVEAQAEEGGKKAGPSAEDNKDQPNEDVGSLGSGNSTQTELSDRDERTDETVSDTAQQSNSAANTHIEEDAAKIDVTAQQVDQNPQNKAGIGNIEKTPETERTRLGDELIFSAPKSVSILAVTHGDSRLVEAWRESVASALSYVEKNYAQARIKEGGELRIEKTDNLVMSRVTHGYDDAGRPHLHDHISIANLTQSKDGQWRALDNRAIWQNSALVGSMQMQEFANRVRPLGYELRHIDDKRGWDLAAVPRDVTLANSPRSEVIKSHTDDIGKSGYGAELIARYETRSHIGKAFDATLLNRRNLIDDRAMGFDGRAAIAEAEKSAAKSEPAQSLAGRVKQTITQSYKAAIETHDAVKSAKLANSPYLPTNIRSLTQSNVEMRAAIELASAIAHKEQFEAGFKERDVMRTALDQAVQGVTLDMLNKRMDQLKEQGLIVPGMPERDQQPSQYITTKDALATEQKIIANIEKEIGQSRPFIEANNVEKAVAPHLKVDVKTGEVMTLKPEQLNAAKLIMASKDGYVNIQGFSGTGKTTLLGPVFDAMKEQGFKVMGIGPSVQSRNEMQGVGAEAITTAKFLKEFEYAQQNPQKMQEMRAEYRGSLLVTDEASFTGNKDMLAITEAKAALGIEKVVTVGDKGQKQSVLAGKAFEVVQTIRTAYAEIREVVRHSNSAIKSYNEHIREGRVKEAFDAVRDSFVVKDNYMKSAVDSYMGRTQAERDQYYLISAGNKDRETLNDMVQAARRQEGSLTGPAITHTIHEQKVLSDQQLRQTRHYVPGNKLEVHVNSRSLGLKRGDYTVEGKNDRMVFVSDANGRTHKFDPRKFEGSNVSRLGMNQRSESIGLSDVKEIQVYQGDQIRFNRNLASEKIVNGDIATIKNYDHRGITFTMADGRDLQLAHSDSQTHKLTLGYALNVDKVQGGSKQGAIMAAGSTSPLSASMRDLYVGPTRAISVLEIHTDSIGSLEISAWKNNRDSTAAMEITGDLDKRALSDLNAEYETLFGNAASKKDADKKDESDWLKAEDRTNHAKIGESFKQDLETPKTPKDADPQKAAGIATRMSIQDDLGKGSAFLNEIAERRLQLGGSDEKQPTIARGNEISSVSEGVSKENKVELGSQSTVATEELAAKPPEKVPELEKTRDFDIS